MTWSPDRRTIAAVTTSRGLGNKNYLYTLDPVLGTTQVRLPLDAVADCDLLQFFPDSSGLIAGRRWRLHSWKPAAATR